MDFLTRVLLPFLAPLWQPIAAVLGGLLAGVFLYFKGRSDQNKKAEIKTLKEINNAHKTRDAVDDAVAGASTAERDRLLNKWSRD